MFGYVPTPKELDHIHFLRREIAQAENTLAEKRNELATYHAEISAAWEADLRRQRECNRNA